MEGVGTEVAVVQSYYVYVGLDKQKKVTTGLNTGKFGFLVIPVVPEGFCSMITVDRLKLMVPAGFKAKAKNLDCMTCTIEEGPEPGSILVNMEGRLPTEESTEVLEFVATSPHSAAEPFIGTEVSSSIVTRALEVSGALKDRSLAVLMNEAIAKAETDPFSGELIVDIDMLLLKAALAASCKLAEVGRIIKLPVVETKKTKTTPHSKLHSPGGRTIRLK